MGNSVKFGEVIDAKIQESKNLCILDKTISPWQNSRLFQLKDEGLFVIKNFMKLDKENQFNLLQSKLRIQQQLIQEDKHPNLLNYYNQSPRKLTQEQVILIRQYISLNLTERLEQLPQSLMEIEKYWLIFQILCGLQQLHSIPLVHGDLKPDNILITSFDWVFIADINPLKPVQAFDTDLKTYNQFFGDLDNNNRCYLAPERWITPPQTLDESLVLHPSMDIFSAGCVIAEILSDGLPLFDLPKLQQYRHKSGSFRPEEALNLRIHNPKIVNLIIKMLDLNPQLRPTAIQCMDWFNDYVFPETFKTVFFQLFSQSIRHAQMFADTRLSLIRYYADAIFFKCFDIQDGARSQGFSVPIDDQTFRLLQLDKIAERCKDLVPNQFKFCDRSMSNSNQDWSIMEKTVEVIYANPIQKQLNKESALILINWIGSQIHVCFNQLDKMAALEMIQKLAKHLSFDVRLNRILPFLSQAFGFDSQEGQVNTIIPQSQVRVKALETLLSLFEDVLDSSEKITMQPSEYKVFQNYVLPLIKRLMDSTKLGEGYQQLQRGDAIVRHAIASNLALITKAGIRCIEIAQASSILLREEINQRKLNVKKEQNQVVESEVTFENAMIAHRTSSMLDQLAQTTSHQRRMTMAKGTKGKPRQQTKQMEQIQEEAEELVIATISTEDIQAPNYDSEVEYVTREIIKVIQSFSGETHDSNSLVAMLANLIELSQIFDVDKGDELFQHCINHFNSQDPRVKIQALKTVMSLSVRVGQKQVLDKILPVVESILNDPEDLVIIQSLKLYNQLVTLRLVNQNQCEKILEQLSLFLLHPNKQIRDNVLKYIYILATLGHEGGITAEEVLGKQASRELSIAKKINFNRGPLFTQVEFYTKIRPKFLGFIKEDTSGRRDITKIHSIKDLQQRLIPPLSLKIYLKCLKDPSKIKEDHPNRDDITALNALSKYISTKFEKENRKRVNQDQNKLDSFQLSQRTTRVKYYRLIKAHYLSVIMHLDMFTNDSFKQIQVEKLQQHSLTKIQVESNKHLQFEPSKRVCFEERETANFGLNGKSVEELKKVDHLMTPEMQNIVDALDLHKERSQVKFLQTSLTTNLGPLKSLQIDQELKVLQLGAQPSVLQHYENVDSDMIITRKVGDELRRKGKPNPYQQHKFQGTLVTTLYEHKNPVNTVAVTENNDFFLTGSRDDKKVLIWKVQQIEQDVSSRSLQSITTDSFVNQVNVMTGTQAIAIGGSGGVQIFDLMRTLQDSHQSQEIVQPQAISNILLKDSRDEVNCMVNINLPTANKQQILCCATQKGGLLIHDVRVQQNLFFDDQIFSYARGAVSCMTMGYEPYQLTVGTLGGYVMVYDLRYNLTSAIFRHHMNYPILALATSKTKEPASTLVSTGGPIFEVSQLNLETGIVDCLFRCNESKYDSQKKDDFEGLRKSDLVTVPEFYKEGTFRDNQLGTLRRESSFKQFNRSMMSVKSSSQFYNLMTQAQSCIKNIDQQLFDASNQRYKLIHDAYNSSNACRTILVPRNLTQSMLFDGSTANYVVTAGNDKKIRYWNLSRPEEQSMIINSPNDEEVSYSSEKITKETTLIQERPLIQRDFPVLTQQRLKESAKNGLNQQILVKDRAYQVKYPGASAYNHIVAGVVQTSIASKGIDQTFSKLQTEKGDGNSLVVNNLNGLASGQQMNDLCIYANGSVEVSEKESQSQLNNDLLSKKIFRSSEIVSHSDTILDIALIEIEQRQEYQRMFPMIVSASRDCTVKVWK